MKIHNTRSPEQWEIISRHVDFKGKTVLDLGCGKGDILIRAFDAGADVTGVDKDEKNVEYIRSVRPEIEVFQRNLDVAIIDGRIDIVICFSVLPYLNVPDSFLYELNYISDVALIECQCAGDGPGFHFLGENDDMKKWLLEAGQFQKVQPIGHTLVEGRDKKRYIWMCE